MNACTAAGLESFSLQTAPDSCTGKWHLDGEYGESVDWWYVRVASMCTFFQKKSELIIVMQLMPYKIDLYFNGLILFSFSYDENIHFYNIPI